MPKWRNFAKSSHTGGNLDSPLTETIMGHFKCNRHYVYSIILLKNNLFNLSILGKSLMTAIKFYNIDQRWMVDTRIAGWRNAPIFFKKKLRLIFTERYTPSVHPQSSSVEADEQLDWPNSQTTMELCPACVAYFWGVDHKHNSFLLGPSSPTTKELHGPSLGLSLVTQCDQIGQFVKVFWDTFSYKSNPNVPMRTF